jgi:hypothetical protein
MYTYIQKWGIELTKMSLFTNSIIERVQVTEGRKYFPGGPHVGQSWLRYSFCNALIKCVLK